MLKRRRGCISGYGTGNILDAILKPRFCDLNAKHKRKSDEPIDQEVNGSFGPRDDSGLACPRVGDIQKTR